MYNTVKKFLALHHHLTLPGIGNFKVETAPAEIDIANRTIAHHTNKIVFTNDKLPAEKMFYNFLSQELNIDEVQAIRSFTNFNAQLLDALNTKNNLQLKGIGILTKQNAHELIFQPEEMPAYFPPIEAERIIRKNATHTVRVGEDERTSDEMHTALNQPATIQKERWWIAATILAAIGIAAIIFYYAAHR